MRAEKKNKILIIADVVSGMRFGGVEKWLQDLSREFNYQGFDVHYFNGMQKNEVFGEIHYKAPKFNLVKVEGVYNRRIS